MTYWTSLNVGKKIRQSIATKVDRTVCKRNNLIFVALLFPLGAFAETPMQAGTNAGMKGLAQAVLMTIAVFAWYGGKKLYRLIKSKVVAKRTQNSSSSTSYARTGTESHASNPARAASPTYSANSSYAEPAAFSTDQAAESRSKTAAQPENQTARNTQDNDDSMYALIADEIESGKTQKGLWTRLYVECDGDEKRTKIEYIKRRVEALTDSLIEPATSAAPLHYDSEPQVAREGMDDRQFPELTPGEVEYLKTPIKAVRYLEKYGVTKDALAKACSLRQISSVTSNGVLWVQDVPPPDGNSFSHTFEFPFGAKVFIAFAAFLAVVFGVVNCTGSLISNSIAVATQAATESTGMPSNEPPPIVQSNVPPPAAPNDLANSKKAARWVDLPLVHPADFMKIPAVDNVLREVVGSSFELFQKNLGVASLVIKEDSSYFAAGCRPHDCGYQAAFTLNPNGNIKASIFGDAGFQHFGAGDATFSHFKWMAKVSGSEVSEKNMPRRWGNTNIEFEHRNASTIATLNVNGNSCVGMVTGTVRFDYYGQLHINGSNGDVCTLVVFSDEGATHVQASNVCEKYAGANCTFSGLVK